MVKNIAGQHSGIERELVEGKVGVIGFTRMDRMAFAYRCIYINEVWISAIGSDIYVSP